MNWSLFALSAIIATLWFISIVVAYGLGAAHAMRWANHQLKPLAGALKELRDNLVRKK